MGKLFPSENEDDMKGIIRAFENDISPPFGIIIEIVCKNKSKEDFDLSYKNKLIDFLQPFVIAESNHFTQDRYIKLISKKLNLKKSYVDNRINFQGDNTWDN